MFYLIEITTYVDDTPTAKGVYSYDTLDDVGASFHQKLAGAMRNANYASELCLIINGEGMIQRHEYWEREIINTEEPEE